MKKLITIIMLVVSWPVLGLPLQLQLKTDFDPHVTSYQGRSGVWFSADEAEFLLKLNIEIVPNLVQIINDQDNLINNQNQQISLLDGQKLELIKEVDLLTVNLTNVNQQYQELQDSQSKWYKSSILWGIVGLLVGTLAGAYIVSR
jgi:hypothetical protein